MSISPILPNHFLEKMDPKDRPKGKAGMTRSQAEAVFIARSEKDIQKQIANYLRLHGIAFYQAAMHKKTTGTVGWPDFTFAINGKACALEVKFGNNKPEPEQRAMMSDMLVNGWRVEVVHSTQEAIAFIERIKHPMMVCGEEDPAHPGTYFAKEVPQ